jgi:hypothetical protein
MDVSTLSFTAALLACKQFPKSEKVGYSDPFFPLPQSCIIYDIEVSDQVRQLHKRPHLCFILIVVHLSPPHRNLLNDREDVIECLE